jgi:uncharacterized protein (DUF433 family)
MRFRHWQSDADTVDAPNGRGIMTSGSGNRTEQQTARPKGVKQAMDRRLVGRYIVTDPGICHGQPTFRGTRILVAHVLEQVAEGMAWEAIIEEWHNSITREAIAEAVQLAGRSFLEHVNEYTLELQPA